MNRYYCNGTCRLCGKSENGRYGAPIKYGIRHYAHADCGLTKWGETFFDRLSVSELQNFPYFAAQKAGLGEVLAARIDANAQRAA